MNRKGARIGTTTDAERRQIEQIGYQVVGSAIRVHRALGPGLLESAYQACLAMELRNAGLWVETEVNLPIKYKGVEVEVGYRLDMLIGNSVVIENKAVERLLSIHTAQILTYLELSGHRLGYLLNWNVTLMKSGIHRFVVGYWDDVDRSGDTGVPEQKRFR
jgi:GxxExxY protein